MLTKEKIIAAIQAMPETEFEDIDVLLEHIADMARKEQKKNELHEPSAVYQTSSMYNGKENATLTFSPKDDAEMMAHIDKKLNEATDPETIYLIKKIKRGIEDSRAGRGITIEEMEKKVQTWFK